MQERAQEKQTLEITLIVFVTVYLFLFSGTERPVLRPFIILIWDSLQRWPAQRRLTHAQGPQDIACVCTCVHEVLYIDSRVSWGVMGFEEIWGGKFQEVCVPVTMIMHDQFPL